MQHHRALFIQNKHLVIAPLRTFLLALTLLCSSLTTGCLRPPTAQEPSVVEAREFEIISLLQKGKDYALSGRIERAEATLRKARNLDPTNATILNDLGYVLQSQFRYREALELYLEAVRNDQSFTEARRNIARLFFEMGDYEQSLLRYKELQLFYLKLENQTGIMQIGELSTVYRAMAQIYYHVGYLDEALCLSGLTFLSGPSAEVGQFSQHLRMLMSVNEIDLALQNVRGSIPFFESGLPPLLLMDYGILLFYKGDYELADEAFTRILSRATDFEVRRTVLLFKYLLTLKKEEIEEAEFIFASLLEEDTSLCEDETFDIHGYWPYRVEAEILEKVAQACSDAN